MVGIVLVSHSAELAAAVKALAEQQTQGRAAIAAIGGTGNPDQPFGTDAMAILEAIRSVQGPDGVLVLMDLGSALMSTEMAIEFMDEPERPKVRMSHAPFVEGAMAAAVQASIGADLAAVEREAAGALGPKAAALSGSSGPAAGPPEALQTMPPASPTAAEQLPGAATGTATLVNPAGLHFGPAVQFVQAASAHQATISVRNLTTGAGPADARRFNQVLGLGAEQGHQIEIEAQGPDAEAALASLVALVRSGFGEGTGARNGAAREARAAAAPVRGEAGQPMASQDAAAAGQGRLVLRGIPASPGIAIGVALFLGGQVSGAAVAPGLGQPARSELGPVAEKARYQAAAAAAEADLAEVAHKVTSELGPAEGRIFEAHRMLLDDPDWLAAVQAGIAGGLTAEAATLGAAEELAGRYAAMRGERLQARAADVRDLGARVVSALSAEARSGGSRSGGPSEAGVPAGSSWSALPESTILLADDLAPSQTATLDREHVIAFCTALGGPTSHSAILARSMDIPAVVGLTGPMLREIRAGDVLAVDGTAGVVVVEPDAATAAAYRARQAAERQARQEARAAAQVRAHTRDGHYVEVAANLAAAADARTAVAAGAEGVGLLRTEFLFQDRTDPPTEEEQLAAYREVLETMAPHRVIVRTLDIGGDKPAPYLRLPAEANPFLGWRAIRVSLAMPEVFKTQLRAILRAAFGHNAAIMFPMIALRSEVEQARALLDEAGGELAKAGLPYAAQLPVGIMVEVPAAAETPDLLTPVVDFFSIGTNDLTQYIFAADRGNARVARLGDPLHPAVLRPIARVIQAAHSAGKWVGLCGELAGQVAAIPVLLGLGLDEFSMAAGSIPGAKATLARLTLPESQALARRALQLPDAAAVRAASADLLK
jgi:phosphocarrier protein FPr